MSTLQSYLVYFMLALIAYFTIFHFLDIPLIHLYDEAIYAINALEMTQTNDFFVLTREYEPSLYNTKPPLVIWLQSISMRVFGINELAVRLPSALSALGVVTILLYFSNKILKKPIIGICSVLVLLSSLGYNNHHVIRTGDLDAVLVFFISLYSLIYIRLLLYKNISTSRSIIFTAIVALLAYLTKSTAGLIPIAGLFVCTLFSQKRHSIFKNKYLYISIFFSCVIVVIYYLLRESLSPGYLEKVFFSEYQRLYADIMPYHKHSSFFYIKMLSLEHHFSPYVYFLPIAIGLGLFSKNQIISRFTTYLSIWCFSYLLIISSAPDKLWWYHAPLIPFFSLLMGVMFYEIYDRLIIRFTEKIALAILITIVAALVSYPMFRVIQKNTSTHRTINPLQEEGHGVRNITRNHPKQNEYTVIMPSTYSEHKDVANFYIKAANYKGDRNIKITSYASEIQEYSKVLVCKQEQKDSLWNKYNAEIIVSDHNCVLWQLGEKK